MAFLLAVTGSGHRLYSIVPKDLVDHATGSRGVCLSLIRLVPLARRILPKTDV